MCENTKQDFVLFSSLALMTLGCVYVARSCANDLIMVHVELLSARLLSFMFIDDTMNLEDFIDMNPDFGEGQVKDLNSFLTMFTS